jgi:hypothetical protein
MSEQAYHAEIAALENALGTLVPAPGQFNRDQVMFRAGRASVKVRGWLWPAATGAMALAAAVFGGMLALRPEPRPATRIVYVTREVPKRTPTAPEKPSPNQVAGSSTRRESAEPPYPQTPYFQMENHLLRWGLDGLPALPPAPPPEPSLTREGILEKPADVSSPVPFFPLTFLQKLGDPS